MHRTSWDTQRLSGTNLDGRAVNSPGQDTFDTIKNLLVGIILVGGGGQLLSYWHANLEYRYAALRIFTSNEKPDPQWTDLDSLL